MADQSNRDIIFADGFIFKRNDSAPEFVVGRISIKVGEAIDFLGTHEKDGWVNLDIKKSRGGKFYVELDTFVPNNAGGNVDNSENQHRNVRVAEKFATQQAEAVEDAETADGEEDGLPF